MTPDMHEPESDPNSPSPPSNSEIRPRSFVFVPGKIAKIRQFYALLFIGALVYIIVLALQSNLHPLFPIYLMALPCSILLFFMIAVAYIYFLLLLRILKLSVLINENGITLQKGWIHKFIPLTEIGSFKRVPYPLIFNCTQIRNKENKTIMYLNWLYDHDKIAAAFQAFNIPEMKS